MISKILQTLGLQSWISKNFSITRTFHTSIQINCLSIVHTVYRQVSILFIFKHDFRWRIDFGPNRPWKGFAWASTHLHVPRCNLSFLPPSIREVGKEKMSILELNSIGLECLTQGWHQFRGCQLWFCFEQFDYCLPWIELS